MNFVIDTKGLEENLVDLNKPQTEPFSIKVQDVLKEWGKLSAAQPKVQAKKDPLKQIVDDLSPFDYRKKLTKFNTPNKSCVEEALKKSVITADFEKLHALPPLENTGRKFKKLQRVRWLYIKIEIINQLQEIAAQTKGKKWFGLPAPEVTAEIKHDLELIQMRSALDPKRFYKKNDLKVLPKYFQIGKIMDSPLDYNNRLTKKERKSTIVDELLNDAEFDRYNKRKYKEIILEKQKTHYKLWRQAKKLKRKKNK